MQPVMPSETESCDTYDDTLVRQLIDTIKVMGEDAKILFCGLDLAQALGYSRTADAIRTHTKGSVKRRIPTNGGGLCRRYIKTGSHRAGKEKPMKALKNDSTIYTEKILSAIRDCYTKSAEPNNGQLLTVRVQVL